MRKWKKCFLLAAVACFQLPLLLRILPQIASEADAGEVGGVRRDRSSDDLGRKLLLIQANSTERLLDSQPAVRSTDVPAGFLDNRQPPSAAATRPPELAPGKLPRRELPLTCPAVDDRGIFVVKDGRGRQDRVKPDEFFERLAFGRGGSQYKPRVLSNDPWVMVLDAFLTEEESLGVVSACGEFRRSSTAGGVAKSIRNSLEFTCRNEQKCWKRKGIATYMKKLSEVTGVSERHFEGITVLKYSKGDFYGRHHDTLNRPTVEHNDGADCYNSTGPRVMTFMSYLTTLAPDQGGATRFNELGPLDVEPLAGRLLLWSDTLRKSPMWPDKRTDHEALMVSGGTKITATVWVHQYDHATSVNRGCCRR